MIIRKRKSLKGTDIFSWLQIYCIHSPRERVQMYCIFPGYRYIPLLCLKCGQYNDAVWEQEDSGRKVRDGDIILR